MLSGSAFGYRNLTIALVGLLVVHPILSDLSSVRWLFPLFFTLVMLFAVGLSAERRYQLIGAGTLLLLVAGAAWTGAFAESPAMRLTMALATVALFAWVVTMMATDVFVRRKVVTADLIFGGINVYLLLGVAFAGAHWAIWLINADAIPGLGPNATLSDALYYSYVTMTTLGYGDISPTGGTARMLAYVQALSGQFYVAILMARLVSLHLTERQNP